MDDPALDESGHAALVARRTGVTGHVVTPTAEVAAEEFDRLFYHQEEPFPSTSIFSSYLVQRLAREHDVTVLLDGQGADEFLAGYAHYPAAALVQAAVSGDAFTWWAERRALRRRTGLDPVPPKSAVWHWWTGGRLRGPVPVDSRRDASFLDDEYASVHAHELPRVVAHGTGVLDTRLRADLLEGHLQELLRYADRNAMAFARETRLPFLDHRLVELVMTRPIALAYRRGESKWILRHAMRGMVPDEILDRTDKVGFATPWGQWTAGPLGPHFRERLREAEQALQGIVRPGVVPLDSAGAIGIMAIASTRRQFADLVSPSLVTL
jgi:asparagine synthase (glutamine-hydrolysing)